MLPVSCQNHTTKGRIKLHESNREPPRARHIMAIVSATCIMIIVCTMLVMRRLSGDMGLAMFSVAMVLSIAIMAAIACAG